MIAKLFNMRRCIIDVNNKIVQKNATIYTKKEEKCLAIILKLFGCCLGFVENNIDTTIPAFSSGTVYPATASVEEKLQDTIQSKVKNIVSNSTVDSQAPDDLQENQATRSASEQADQVPQAQEPTDTGSGKPLGNTSDPKHQRTVLYVYGRFLTLHKPINAALILILATIVISAVIIAGFQGCFLANLTVYQDSPCPYYGTMQCFFGPNATYFECTPNATVDIPSLSTGATCFRWIGHDTSIADVMTQIGACVGLLTALGSVVEILIRLLFFVFQQRLCVATGLESVMGKTIGVNETTQPFHCCKRKLPCHCSVLNHHQYRYPLLVFLTIVVYISLPVFCVVSIILLTHFKISITALTYIVIITFVAICVLGLLWLILGDDEFNRIMPGAWEGTDSPSPTIKKLMQTLRSNLKETIPKELLDKLDSTGKMSKTNIDSNSILFELFQYNHQRLTQLEQLIPRKQFITNEVTQFGESSQMISARIRSDKNLVGQAQKVRQNLEEERLKDVRNSSGKEKAKP